MEGRRGRESEAATNAGRRVRGLPTQSTLFRNVGRAM